MFGVQRTYQIYPKRKRKSDGFTAIPFCRYSEATLETEARDVQPIHLAQLAGEIAETKGIEELTPEIRRTLQRQDQTASRRRLFLAAPWLASACLIVGLVTGALTVHT
jgi:hypothetical protein